jgi:hypothetical protein
MSHIYSMQEFAKEKAHLHKECQQLKSSSNAAADKVVLVGFSLLPLTLQIR